MINGLVGHTGFVGGNLAAQRRYDAMFHRPNIASIHGIHFDRLVISGAPSQKWRANADPTADAESIDGLIDHLRDTRAERTILISTIDIYPIPIGVDEDTIVEPDDHAQAYGRNRLRLEKFVQRHYPRSLVLRLPALFGPGLKKNLIFDLMQGRQEEFCHRDSTFQFYDLKRLSSDVDTALDAGLPVLNLATEPLAAQQIAQGVFDRTLTCVDVPQATYDMHTRHADVFGAHHPYLVGGDEVMAGIHAFAKEGPLG